MINLVDLAERGWIPDALLRVGMRRLLVKRLAQDRVNATPEGKAAVEDVPKFASGGVTFVYTDIEEVI